MSHKCQICSEITYEKTDRKGRIFHFCRNCRFISLDSSFFLTPEQEKKRYELHNNTLENQGYKKWLNSFIDQAVSPYVPVHGQILDFGSGPNPVLKILLEQKGFSVNIYDKYFYDVPFSGLYDTITATEVMEHIASPVQLLDTLKKSLKTKGHLAIKTEFRPDKDEDFLKWWYKEDPTHISFFSRHTFNILSDKIGLGVIFSDNFSIIIFRN
ncbi:MAG: class I SAM-dependent methyltransferase [Spirochaetaceae bacterium]|nr:class I SAM-dependent methyltransferase [Spirochaetaceae bacterium]